MIMPLLCTVCISDKWRCTCPYFHAPMLRTPFLLPVHIDHKRPNPFDTP